MQADKRLLNDNGHFIVDCHFGGPLAIRIVLADSLVKMPGVVEHGLFIGIAKAVISAGPGGLEISGQRD